MTGFKTRRLIIIMAALCLAVAIILLAWKIFTAAPAPTPTAPAPTVQNGNGVLPQAGTGGQPNITENNQQALTDTGASAANNAADDSPTAPATDRSNKIQDLIEYTSAAAALAGDGESVQYYDRADNKFYKLDAAGQPQDLSGQSFYNVSRITWSANKEQAVLEYPDQSKIIYNFTTGRQVSLPKHWSDFSFDPTGQQLIFKSIGYDPADSWLGVVSSDGTGERVIAKIGANADEVITGWSPNNQIVAMYSEGQSFEQKTVYFVGLNNENFRSITVNGRGFTPLWSPDGSRLLYSVYSTVSNLQPTLWTVEARGDSIGANSLPLNLNTWADKCVFASPLTAYCAVPVNLPTGAGLSPASSLKNTDQLYLISLDSGQKTLVDDGRLYNMTDLILTKDQKSLYFTDKISGKLYRLSL